MNFEGASDKFDRYCVVDGIEYRYDVMNSASLEKTPDHLFLLGYGHISRVFDRRNGRELVNCTKGGWFYIKKTRLGAIDPALIDKQDMKSVFEKQTEMFEVLIEQCEHFISRPLPKQREVLKQSKAFFKK